MILHRVRVSHMAQMQDMPDFPPAPELDPVTSRLDPAKATPAETRAEVVLRQGQLRRCHSGAANMDHQMHDLLLEPFTGSRATARSRPSPSAASRTAPRTCTTAGT